MITEATIIQWENALEGAGWIRNLNLYWIDPVTEIGYASVTVAYHIMKDRNEKRRAIAAMEKQRTV